jgi:hypothetical protein
MDHKWHTPAPPGGCASSGSYYSVVDLGGKPEPSVESLTGSTVPLARLRHAAVELGQGARLGKRLWHWRRPSAPATLGRSGAGESRFGICATRSRKSQTGISRIDAFLPWTEQEGGDA